MVNTPPCQGGDRQFEPGRGRHNLLFIMKRHYTATALIVENNSVLLHLHEKIKLWLPPGGHVELNEDPIQAVTREVFEETGFRYVNGRQTELILVGSKRNHLGN